MQQIMRKDMRQRSIAALSVLIIILSAFLLSSCSAKDDIGKKNLENILDKGISDASSEKGAYEDKDLLDKYSPSIIAGKEGEGAQIILKIDGKDYTYPYDERYKGAMMWIKENLPEKSTITAWWPHAGMIMAYTKEYAFAFAPSAKSFENGAVDKKNWPSDYLSADKDLYKLASALLSTDSRDTWYIMDDYLSDFIMVFKDDDKYLEEMYGVLGRNVSEHYDGSRLSKNARLTVFNRVMKNSQVASFSRVYHDDFVSIYIRENRFMA